MFRLIFVGLAAGLATAIPMELSAPCPCLSSSGATASTTDAYGAAGGAQAANYMASSEAATATSVAYGAAWGVQTTNYGWGTSTASCGAPATSTAGGASTHTVIVAPTQGILRYVPFVVNASAGDTINFMWNANNHTVTKSSQLAVSLAIFFRHLEISCTTFSDLQ